MAAGAAVRSSSYRQPPPLGRTAGISRKLRTKRPEIVTAPRLGLAGAGRPGAMATFAMIHGAGDASWYWRASGARPLLPRRAAGPSRPGSSCAPRTASFLPISWAGWSPSVLASLLTSWPPVTARRSATRRNWRTCLPGTRLRYLVPGGGQKLGPSEVLSALNAAQKIFSYRS